MTRIVEDVQSITAKVAASVLLPHAETGRVTLEIGGKYVQEIVVVSTPSNIEGLIRWFLCPACRERVGKLYLPSGEAVFLCRKCHGLAYRAQQVRAFRKPARLKECGSAWQKWQPKGQPSAISLELSAS